MSGYNGRRGPNVSQYVAGLNIPTSNLDHLAEPLNLEEDLALFSNSDFIDWDAGNGEFDPQALDFNLDVDQTPTQLNPSETKDFSDSAHKTTGSREPKMDFNLDGDFQFADFSGFSNPIVDQSIPSLPHSQQPQQSSFPIPPNFASPVTSSVSPVTPQFDHSGKKRKLDNEDAHSHQAIDEAARVAAEEDKRRRNTAASARFRVKKKQREQALEKTAKEMTEKVNLLENRIQQLETENTWLKGLITEKNGGKSSISDISALLKKHEKENASGERSTGNRTDGVGTAVKDPKA
ncbi:uncharacterized protein BDR25DRAFT_21168 [Lindgomyces ingoldianus]|uniref:Uncharacterized protein n=1 Tax=Lindgomyces ingoldianus TaxID=673940 RepID=A0ACB6QX25_9PLEO|nr:uncharacterized protein BDR25DRAFT_21168 [Lindgomyces ingoldianus]KAF2471568.1 hypothetical protein BDR25DRAFT_21168 [Lindgomyces ingoldianus]